MQIRLLGPLEVADDARPLVIGPPKQKTLLALLAIQVNRVVAVEEIVEELWEEAPPQSALANLRLYASNLRRLSLSILKRGFGYELAADEERIDLDFQRFRLLTRLGRESFQIGRTSRAVEIYDEAIHLWRGKPLVDVPTGPSLVGWRTALEGEWLRAKEDRAECLLRNGDLDRAVVDATDVLRMSPLRERAHTVVVRARYQAGDVLGALQAFDSARAMLADELGIEPGDELRHLHRAVLRRDSAANTPPRATAEREVPVTTMPAYDDLADRLRWLEALLRQMSDERQPMLVVMLTDAQ